MVLTWCSQDITLSLPSLIIHKWPSGNVKSDTSSVTSVLTSSLSRLKTSHRRDIYRCGWFFCEFAKWPPCPLRRVQQIAPLPDFHGNLHFHHSVILDRRLGFTPSAICLSNMEVCLGFPFFPHTDTHTHTKKSLSGGSKRGKAWQSTKQIPSTCLCKLFMLLMHYASGMRHTQIKQHCFMFCLHVSK